jgi:hypothetical protein
MSYVIAEPDVIAAAAADVAAIGSTLDVANMAAALPTVALAPAAADEVSAGIAQLFSEHARDYQAAARQAAASLEQFGENLVRSSGLYAFVEVSASFLHETKALVREVLIEVLTEVFAVVGPLGHAALVPLFDLIRPQLDQWVTSNPGLATFFVGAFLILLLLFAIALISLGVYTTWALPAFFLANPALSGLVEFIAAA